MKLIGMAKSTNHVLKVFHENASLSVFLSMQNFWNKIALTLGYKAQNFSKPFF